MIAWDEAIARFQRSGADPAHTFLFDLGDSLVIDGGHGGNSSRWINHGCAPSEAERAGHACRCGAPACRGTMLAATP